MAHTKWCMKYLVIGGVVVLTALGCILTPTYKVSAPDLRRGPVLEIQAALIQFHSKNGLDPSVSDIAYRLKGAHGGEDWLGSSFRAVGPQELEGPLGVRYRIVIIDQNHFTVQASTGSSYNAKVPP